MNNNDHNDNNIVVRMVKMVSGNSHDGSWLRIIIQHERYLMCLLLLMVTAMCSFARTGFVLRREGHLLGFGNGCPFYSFGKGLLGRIKTVKSGWRN